VYERTLFITTPVANELFDEDSGDDDEGGTIDNLSVNQLLAEVEIIRRIADEEDDLLTHTIPITQKGAFEEKKKTLGNKPGVKETPSTWVKGDFLYSPPNFPVTKNEYSFHENLTPVKLFELFIGSDIM